MDEASEASIQETLQKGIRAARRGHTEPAKKLLIQVVQAEPTCEKAWLWLARVVEAPAQRSQCLERVLALNPENRWAAEQLEALQATPAEGTSAAEEAAPQGATSEAASSPPEQSPELDLKLLKCLKCGAPVKPSDDTVQTFVCQHCGSVLNLTGDKTHIMGKAEQRVKPSMPIEPGMEGTFGKERYQVIGWIRYRGWDSEESWYWDEWSMVTPEGKYLWLSYDREEGFILQHKIPLPPDTNINRLRITGIPVPGGTAHVTEEGPARIIALKGELPWRAKVGETTRYYDARRGEKRYSLERGKNELELYEGAALSPVQVWQAFGRKNLVEKARQNQKVRDRYRRLSYLSFALSCIAALLSCIFSLLSGNLLAEQRFTLSNTHPIQEIPFEVKRPNRAYRVSLEAFDLPTNSWAVVDVSMSDPADNEFYLFSEEFWDEAGRDSDGYWHESDLKGRQLIRPDTEGMYELYVEASEATVTSVEVRTKISGPVWVSQYFIAFTVLTGFLGFVFLGSSQTGSPGTAMMKFAEAMSES